MAERHFWKMSSVRVKLSHAGTRQLTYPSYRALKQRSAVTGIEAKSANYVFLSLADLTCWTCPNKTDNEACNNWAPDVHCPLSEYIPHTRLHQCTLSHVGHVSSTRPFTYVTSAHTSRQLDTPSLSRTSRQHVRHVSTYVTSAGHALSLTYVTSAGYALSCMSRQHVRHISTYVTSAGHALSLTYVMSARTSRQHVCHVSWTCPLSHVRHISTYVTSACTSRQLDTPSLSRMSRQHVRHISTYITSAHTSRQLDTPSLSRTSHQHVRHVSTYVMSARTSRQLDTPSLSRTSHQHVRHVSTYVMSAGHTLSLTYVTSARTSRQHVHHVSTCVTSAGHALSLTYVTSANTRANLACACSCRPDVVHVVASGGRDARPQSPRPQDVRAAERVHERRRRLQSDRRARRPGTFRASLWEPFQRRSWQC